MPVSVTMPRLGESVTEGTVTRWLKQEGDTVEVDEPLLEVSTDKVDTEIPSPAAGVLTRIVVGEDETAEVGSELAVISGEGESAGGGAAPQQQEEAPAEQAAEGRGGAVGRRGADRAAGAGGTGTVGRGHPGADAGPGRERHRGYGHPLAQAGRRDRRGRRAAAGGLHRQGRHRDPLAGRRYRAGDQGRRGRDRRGRRDPGRGRCRRWRPGRVEAGAEARSGGEARAAGRTRAGGQAGAAGVRADAGHVVQRAGRRGRDGAGAGEGHRSARRRRPTVASRRPVT